MYLMVEFRCVKCDDKEYGIVYYEKVFSLELFMVSKVEGRGNIKKKIIVFPAGMNSLAAEWQQTAVSSSCLYIHKSNHIATTRLQKLITHVMQFWVIEFNKYARD